LYLLDGRELDKEEDRLFLALYGQDFEKNCSQCTLNKTIPCPMVEHLGELSSDEGCRPNLGLMLEQYRNEEIMWFDYELEVRGKTKSGFRGLQTESGSEITLMEWTHQVDKETSLLKFVTEGAGWVESGSTSYPLITEAQLPVHSLRSSNDQFIQGERWTPSPGLLFCMGLAGE